MIWLRLLNYTNASDTTEDDWSYESCRGLLKGLWQSYSIYNITYTESIDNDPNSWTQLVGSIDYDKTYINSYLKQETIVHGDSSYGHLHHFPFLFLLQDLILI